MTITSTQTVCTGPHTEAKGERLFLTPSSSFNQKGIRVASTLHKVGQWICDKLGIKSQRYVTELTLYNRKYLVNTSSLKSYIATDRVAKAFFSHAKVRSAEMFETHAVKILKPGKAAFDSAYDTFKCVARQRNTSDDPDSKKLGDALINLTFNSDQIFRKNTTSAELKAALQPAVDPTYLPPVVEVAPGKDWQQRASDKVYSSTNWETLFNHVLDSELETVAPRRASADSDTNDAISYLLTPDLASEASQDSLCPQNTSVSSQNTSVRNVARTAALTTLVAGAGFLAAGPIGLLAGAVVLGSAGYDYLRGQ